MKLVKAKDEFLQLKNFRRITEKYERTLYDECPENSKKIVELMHIGKFLMYFGLQAEIEEIRERPDFIISTGEQRVGLEHVVLVDEEFKQKEGFYANLISKVEKELQKDSNLPDLLVTIYPYDYIQVDAKNKGKVIREITNIVRIYISTGVLVENEIIAGIEKMEHYFFSLSPNTGGWWQSYLTKDLLYKAIAKKEAKIKEYKQNTGLFQWLLIVIGGSGQSSYVIDEKIIFNQETSFDKIYVLEENYAKLYEVV